jgi:hypothetical protein
MSEIKNPQPSIAAEAVAAYGRAQPAYSPPSMRKPCKIAGIINRAYYAVFLSCNSFLAELGFKASKGPQTHGELLARINNCGIPDLQSIYEGLFNLYRRRRQADYDLTSQIFRARASAGLDAASATQMIAIVKRCRESQDLRIQIRNGIREYERQINP